MYDAVTLLRLHFNCSGYNHIVKIGKNTIYCLPGPHSIKDYYFEILFKFCEFYSIKFILNSFIFIFRRLVLGVVPLSSAINENILHI